MYPLKPITPLIGSLFLYIAQMLLKSNSFIPSERVPSANFVGVIELRKHLHVFHKKSDDGSSKCNLFQTGSESDIVYDVDPEHKSASDCFERKG